MPSRIITFIQVADETIKDPGVKVKENTDSAISRLSSISKQKNRKKALNNLINFNLYSQYLYSDYIAILHIIVEITQVS